MQHLNLEPAEVYAYFEKIASIPHGSFHTEALSDYCLDFAREHGLKAVRDKAGNVVIYAPGTEGYEASAPVVLQGHLDMVAEKEQGAPINMLTDGLKLCTDGETVWAHQTTLGGDDGIAVAFILAILASDSIPHPPIEALFTNNEEVGMQGVREFDVNLLKSRRLINIDSEQEGILYVSCAGGIRTACKIPFTRVSTAREAASTYSIKASTAGPNASSDSPSASTASPNASSDSSSASTAGLNASSDDLKLCARKVEISGLRGGHSGMQISDHRENAIVMLGSTLGCASRSCALTISSIEGGGKENAIPSHAEAVICLPENEASLLSHVISEYLMFLHQEYSVTEPDLQIKVTETDLPKTCMDRQSTDRIIFALQQIPNGMQRMSPEMPDMVQTSLNMGTALTNEDNVEVRFLVRSNTGSGKQLILEKLTEFIKYLGGQVDCHSDYPAWEYKAKSPLRETMIRTFSEVYGYAPQVMAIHAGLECGILSGKAPLLDMISFGPTLMNVHTPQEHMDVASVARSYEYLKKVLENLN